MMIKRLMVLLTLISLFVIPPQGVMASSYDELQKEERQWEIKHPEEAARRMQQAEEAMQHEQLITNVKYGGSVFLLIVVLPCSVLLFMFWAVCAIWKSVFSPETK